MTGFLTGKRALVTGGASGIGRAIAVALAAEGCRVAIADVAPKNRIDKACAGIGADSFGVDVDVSDEAQVVELFNTAMPRLGGLDILVSNAGILLEKPLLQTSAADFDRLIGVNLPACS